jgi:hypothetical protein
MSRPQRLIKDGQRQIRDKARRVGAEGEACCCTFACFPAADEFSPSDAEIIAMYPDIWMRIDGIQICACFVSNPGSEWTIYTEHDFAGHQYLLVPDVAPSRSGTAHQLHYSYFSDNDPLVPSVGDGEITSTAYTGAEEDECTTAGSATVSDVYIVQVGVYLQCSTDSAPDWTWGFDSLVIGVGAGDIFNVSSFPAGTWSGDLATAITTVPNYIAMGDCHPGSHPGGDGNLVFEAVSPGLGPP